MMELCVFPPILLPFQFVWGLICFFITISSSTLGDRTLKCLQEFVTANFWPWKPTSELYN